MSRIAPRRCRASLYHLLPRLPHARSMDFAKLTADNAHSGSFCLHYSVRAIRTCKSSPYIVKLSLHQTALIDETNHLFRTEKRRRIRSGCFNARYSCVELYKVARGKEILHHAWRDHGKQDCIMENSQTPGTHR